MNRPQFEILLQRSSEMRRSDGELMSQFRLRNSCPKPARIFDAANVDVVASRVRERRVVPRARLRF